MKRGNPQNKSRHQSRLASGQRNRRLTLENLETRQLMAAAIGAGGPGFVPGFGVLDNVAPRNVGSVTAFQFNETELATGRGINDSRGSSEALPLGTQAGQQHTIDIRGSLPPLTTSTLNGTQFEDVDYFNFNLRAGDILDIAATGAAGSFDVYLPDGRHWFGTDTSQAIFYPAKSPLMTVGNAVGAQVAPFDGNYSIRVARGPVIPPAVPLATTAYTLGLRVYRPVLEQQAIGVQQKVFLDFDGELVAGSRLPVGATGTLRVPSLADSLNLINLTPQEEDLLIDNVLAALENRFASVVQFGNNGNFNATGVPGQFGIQFLNSRDHADPGEDPFTTRAIVGGSTADIQVPGVLGISTILDVGNFDPGGLVFLPVEFFEAAVIGIQRVSSKSLLDILADRLATTIAHEIGHSFGLRHTDPLNTKASIIDTGGTAQVQLNAVGAGPDGIYGSIDDTPIVFPQFDRFEPNEGFFGNQWVASNLAWSLASGKVGAAISGTVFNDANRDSARGGSESGLAGVTVFVDINGNGVFDSGETSATTAADGSFSLAVAAGNAQISIVPPTGFVLTTPASRPVSGAASNITFGLHRPDASFTGRKFADLNGNGALDTGENGIGGVFIYIDLDRDGGIDIGEPRAITNSDGTYTLNFAGLQTGQTYRIREVVEPGFEQIAPASGFHEFVYSSLNTPIGLNFANRPSRDFGDAPDTYMTSLSAGGPNHGIIAGLSLGAQVDRDLDGQPTLLSNGDDVSGGIGSGGVVVDDEDGIRVLSPIAPGATATFEVNISNTTGQVGYLQAWFDYNKDGTFSGIGEKVLTNRVLPAGTNLVNINIPAGVTTGNLYTRWRYSLTPDLGIGGSANSGEVEDHLFNVQAQAKVANDDAVNVPRNQPANQIFVLANDFETPENPLRITGFDEIVLGTRGDVILSSDQRSVFYTPPLGFVGQDRFTYTVTPQFGAPSTATVTVNVTFQSDVPVALDDSFVVAQGSNNVALNVLDNDLPSSFGGITIVTVTAGTEGGSTRLEGGNQTVRYTPRAGFAGTEEFFYTISDANGNISTATATVNMSPGSSLDDVVGFKIEFLDVVNAQPITDIQAGQEFFARVTVEDLRTPLNQTGVFSAFMDLLYTDELVSILPDGSNPLGFAVQFGNLFQSGITGLQSGDASIPGLLDEVGSQRISLQSSGVAEGAIELFTVRFQAVSPGVATFLANPADEVINETTVYNRSTELAVRELRLGMSELVISPANDNFTSAIDDAYPDGRDSTGARISSNQAAQLDVLANDLLGPTDAISEFFIVAAPGRGTATVNGDIILYTPNGSVVNQFDSFTYGIVTEDGVRSTAEVTLFVGDPIAAQNQAPVGNKPFDVDISLKVVDGNGGVLNRVVPGTRFGVQVIVQDLRAALQANPLGVFAAFSDILYDADLIRPSNQILNDQFDFDVTFPPDSGFGLVGAFGVADRLGIIDEFGSFLANTNPTNNPPHPSLTGQPVVLATLFFDAIGTGDLRLVSSPADATPFRDTLLFQPAEPVEVPRIRYNVTNVPIGGSGSGEGEFRQNGLLPADVNADGNVTPIDALSVINQIGRALSGASGESAASPTNLYSDVNGDGQITPLDALVVLNYIGKARRGDVPIDLAQLSALQPNANGVIPVDSYAALNELLSGRFTGGSGTGEGEGSSAALTPAAIVQGPSDSDEDEEDSLLGLLADDVAALWK